MNSITLTKALELFLMEDRAPTTRSMYNKIITRAINIMGPERTVDSVAREDVLYYIRTLREQPVRYAEHPTRPLERGGLAPRTIEKHIKTTITFFRWLEDQDYIDHQPTAKLRLKHWRRPAGSSKAATPEELQAMLEIALLKAKLKKPFTLALFLFICDTGARAGETANLTIGNLLLAQRAGWVHGKGDKVRPIFYGSRTAEALHAWLEKHPHPVSSESMFRLTAGSVSQAIRRLAHEAGIERSISAHAIRHRVGQVWSNARLGEQATQMKLGHEDPAITIEMYQNTTWDHVKQASEELALAAIFGIPSEPEYLPPPNIVVLPQRKTS